MSNKNVYPIKFALVSKAVLSDLFMLFVNFLKNFQMMDGAYFCWMLQMHSTQLVEVQQYGIQGSYGLVALDMC